MVYFKVCKDKEQLLDRLSFIQATTYLLNHLTTLLLDDLKKDPVPYTPYMTRSLGRYTEEFEIVADMAAQIGAAAESL